MIYTALTKKAIKMAYAAHEGQTDRDGIPYICHPLLVAEQMQDEKSTVVALLHDVLEDTDLTKEALLSEGIPEDCVEAIVLLTRNRKAAYQAYIDRLVSSGNRLALSVKCADLGHNMAKGRCPGGKLPDFLKERYTLAAEKIRAAL